MKNLLSISSLCKDEILQLINRALELKNGAQPTQRPDLFISNLFFENSTRTKKSFEIAQRKLLLEVIDFETSTSSIQKGETLYDTCKTLEMLGVNLLVIRHPENEYYKELEALNIPIINGGDGSGQHPSQCLLDMMTIYEKFGSFVGKKVLILGDIKNSRVARSNKDALTLLGADVKLSAPSEWQDKSLGEYVDLDSHLAEVDVLMLLRIQHERHHNSSFNFTKEEYHQQYGITEERYKQLGDHTVILHPAPVNRGVEIASSLVEADKSLIFEQMRNGMYMRQAILEFIINKNNL